MDTKRRWQWICALNLGLALSSLTGCQTSVGGMTLPSGHYLRHPPQYIPPSPPFPLPREQMSMETAAAAARNVAPAAPVPIPPPPMPAAPLPPGQ